MLNKLFAMGDIKTIATHYIKNNKEKYNFSQLNEESQYKYK